MGSGDESHPWQQSIIHTSEACGLRLMEYEAYLEVYEDIKRGTAFANDDALCRLEDDTDAICIDWATQNRPFSLFTTLDFYTHPDNGKLWVYSPETCEAWWWRGITIFKVTVMMIPQQPEVPEP